MATEKKKWTKKRIILEVVEWFLVIFCVTFVVFVAVFASKNPTSNSSASIFGYETRMVVSGSMEGSDEFYKDKNYKVGKIQTGSLIFIDSAPINNVWEPSSGRTAYSTEFTNYISKIEVGTVVTFTPTSGSVMEAITHRVINIETKGNLTYYTTHGDAVEEGNNEVFPANNLIGIVFKSSKFLGDLYNNFFTNKPVIATVIIVPCAAIIVYEIIKIVKIVKEDKKNKALVAESSIDSRIKSINDLVDAGVLTKEEAQEKIKALSEKQQEDKE